jgi:hypothetical protein
MASANGSGHREYVTSQRKRAGEIATDILAGRVSMLEGARQLTRLRHEIEVGDDDPDIHAMVLIESETESLPIGAERASWGIRGLTENQPRLLDAEAWAREVGVEACRNLARRFGAA